MRSGSTVSRPRSGPRLRAVMVAVIAASLLPGATAASVAAAAQDDEASSDAAARAAREIAAARAERDALQERLDEATEQLGTLQAREATLEAEADDLAAQAEALTGAIGTLRDGMHRQVVSLFKRGSVRDPVTVFLTSSDPQQALMRAHALEQVLVGDLGDLELLAADRRRLEVVTVRLDAARTELDEVVAEQEGLLERLDADLRRASELEQRLVEDERRRREAEERARREREARERAERERIAAAAAAGRGGSGSGGSSSGGGSGSGSGSGGGGGGARACPVGQPRSFSNTWGAPRSGGRSHRGTDILAPYGTPVYAIVGGTWSIQRPGPSAGLWAILRGDDGNHYWYLHLQSHTVGNGARVRAGQQVATNGDTGNARGTPHVHFELHPGGGSAVNPYSTLRGVC